MRIARNLRPLPAGAAPALDAGGTLEKAREAGLDADDADGGMEVMANDDSDGECQRDDGADEDVERPRGGHAQAAVIRPAFVVRVDIRSRQRERSAKGRLHPAVKPNEGRLIRIWPNQADRPSPETLNKSLWNQ